MLNWLSILFTALFVIVFMMACGSTFQLAVIYTLVLGALMMLYTFIEAQFD